MKYKKCYLFAFLLTLITCYMAQATQILDPEDRKEEKSSIIPCLPIENQLSANLVPELSASQVSSKKLSNLIHSSGSADSVHLYDLPSDLLPKILGYVGVAEPRAVSQLFYYYVTGEFVEDGTKAKGMSEGTHSRGISGEKDYSYDFKLKVLYFKDKKGEVFFRLLPIKQVPTWFWQKWIKKVDNIAFDQINSLKNTNIYILNLKLNNKIINNWASLFEIISSDSHNIDKDNSLLFTKLKELQDKNIIIINIINNNDGYKTYRR